MCSASLQHKSRLAACAQLLFIVCWYSPPCAVRAEAGSLEGEREAPPRRQLADSERPPRDGPSGRAFGRPRSALYSFELYAVGGGLSLDGAKARKEGLTSPGGVSGALRATILKYLFLDLGVGYLFAADHEQFREQACSTVTGECMWSSSGVHGVTAWAEAGLQLRLVIPVKRAGWQIATFAGAGHRGVSMTRSAEFRGPCTDCRSDSLDIDGGVYLTPSIELSYVWLTTTTVGSAAGLKVDYEHFLTGDVVRGIWAGLFLEYLIYP